MAKGRILLTGGLGYIGAHTAVALHQEGYEPILIDNLSNSQAAVADAISELLGTAVPFEKGDCRDARFVDSVFSRYAPLTGVVHFAALKAVGESVKRPLAYYSNNLISLLVILEAMGRHRCANLVFSSSASVYGEAKELPVTEQSPLQEATSPYGASKSFAERIITDAANANPNMRAIALRYFNPIGAHRSAKIGELPNGEPDNLLPYITQTANGLRAQLTIYGNDYNTPDGTALRDYFHVMDLARAHALAINTLVTQSPEEARVEYINVGSGSPSSVLEILTTFSKVNNVEVPFVYGPRRAGDVESVWADISYAKTRLGWEPQLSLEEALKDAWRWELQNKGADL